MTRGSWPSIDHSTLSPSGRVSARARKAALKREAERLFSGVDLSPKTPELTTEERHQALLRSAQNLRDLAARGVKPRAYIKAAEKLEKEAEELVSKPREEIELL